MELGNLTGTTLEGLAEEEDLELIVDGEDTSTGDTTENVGTSTLEERLDTLLGDDLGSGIEGRLVLDGLTGGHHHATTDGVKGVRGDTSGGGDAPAESERGEEVVLEVTDEEDGLDGVVETEVETTVNNDTSDGGTETTVETGNTIGSDGLAVDIDEAVELTLTTLLGGLGVVGETGTGVIEGVDEEEGSGTSGTTGGKVTSHPLPVAILVLLEAEHGLELVAESEVEGLGGEVTDDVGGVATPQGHDTLIGGGALEAVDDTVVAAVETAGADHLILEGCQYTLSYTYDEGVLVSPIADGGRVWHVTAQINLRADCYRTRGSQRPKVIPFSGRQWENEVIIGTYLVLDEELDTLNGSGSGLRDGGGDTTHQEIRHEGL